MIGKLSVDNCFHNWSSKHVNTMGTFGIQYFLAYYFVEVIISKDEDTYVELLKPSNIDEF